MYRKQLHCLRESSTHSAFNKCHAVSYTCTCYSEMRPNLEGPNSDSKHVVIGQYSCKFRTKIGRGYEPILHATPIVLFAEHDSAFHFPCKDKVLTLYVTLHLVLMEPEVSIPLISKPAILQAFGPFNSFTILRGFHQFYFLSSSEQMKVPFQEIFPLKFYTNVLFLQCISAQPHGNYLIVLS